MQVYHGFAPFIAGTHQFNRDAVGIGIGIKLRVPAETADIGFIGELDRDLCLVDNWMQHL